MCSRLFLCHSEKNTDNELEGKAKVKRHIQYTAECMLAALKEVTYTHINIVDLPSFALSLFLVVIIL
jgi:hypothetical protein